MSWMILSSLLMTWSSSTWISATSKNAQLKACARSSTKGILTPSGCCWMPLSRGDISLRALRRHLRHLRSGAKIVVLFAQRSQFRIPIRGREGFVVLLARFLEVFESSDPALLPNSSDLPNPWWEQISNDANKKKRSKAQRSCLKSQLSTGTSLSVSFCCSRWRRFYTT